MQSPNLSVAICYTDTDLLACNMKLYTSLNFRLSLTLSRDVQFCKVQNDVVQAGQFSNHTVLTTPDKYLGDVHNSQGNVHNSQGLL